MGTRVAAEGRLSSEFTPSELTPFDNEPTASSMLRHTTLKDSLDSESAARQHMLELTPTSTPKSNVKRIRNSRGRSANAGAFLASGFLWVWVNNTQSASLFSHGMQLRRERHLKTAHS